MDLSELDNLHEAALLHTVGQRYCGGDKLGGPVDSYYCTFIGNICVAVNPFAPQQAWRNTFVLADYLKMTTAGNGVSGGKKKLQPHPWSVAELAYTELTTKKMDQAVLICGESGAGKTECCKFVLNYLINKKASTVADLAEKLMDTNDPLEAFGNAKTVRRRHWRRRRRRLCLLCLFVLFCSLLFSLSPCLLVSLSPNCQSLPRVGTNAQVNNDNSSRFAKCMQIELDSQGR
eukprot:SAG22_NODE_61_length_23387_cov_34.380582_17_plen_232_part_00